MSIDDTTGSASARTATATKPCPVCSQTLPASAAYCPWCGSQVGLVPTGMLDDTLDFRPPPPPPPAPTDQYYGATALQPGPLAVEQPPTRPSRRKLLIGSAIAVVVLVVAGALAWVLVPTSADRMMSRSTDALAAAVTDLASVERTADIRGVAAQAATPAQAADDFLADQSGGAPADLVAVSGALSAIASLEGVSGEDPQAWTAAEPAIRSLEPLGLDALPPGSANTAADKVQDVVTDAVNTYQAWVAENAEAVAARDAAVADATSYQRQMQDQLDEYVELRNGLSDYIEIVDTQGSTMSEAYAQFGAAAEGRREVRDAMLALDPPAAVANEHGQVVAVISDGIDAIESAQRALDTAECSWGVCYVEDEPAYQAFRSESKRITKSLDAAIADWKVAAAQAVAEAQAMPLPAKPEV